MEKYALNPELRIMVSARRPVTVINNYYVKETEEIGIKLPVNVR